MKMGWRGVRMAWSIAPLRNMALRRIAVHLIPKPSPLYLVDIGFVLWQGLEFYLDEKGRRQFQVEKAIAIQHSIEKYSQNLENK